MFLRTRSLIPLALLAAACGSHAGSYAIDVGGDDGGALSLTSIDGSVQALDAYIENKGVAVTVVTLSCSGSCAEVQAVGTGGSPPYTYRWNDGVIDATRMVCPSSTTGYSVAVTDTGSTGELGRRPQTVQASVTADVIACPEGGITDAGAVLPLSDACTDEIQNPSFEGTPQTDNITPWDAPAWVKCAGSPAEISGPSTYVLGPFMPSVTVSPTDGKTAIWIQPSAGLFVPGPGGAGQSLCAPIPAGGSLSFRIDARMLPVDTDAGPPTQSFQVFGGNTACCDPAGCGSTASPLLYTSPSLSTDWGTYCVTLAPAEATGALTFTAAGLATSASAHVVLDHIVAVSRCP